MLCTPAALQLRLANARRRQPAQGECAERPLASPAPARPARRAAPRPAAALDASAAAAAPAAATGPATAADAAEVTHLRELRLENWALVEAATVSLRPGLTVLTGESGAGKSALVSALACLAGAPTAPEAVRPPADAAVVEGVFLLAPADRAAIARHLGMVQDLNASTRRDAQAAVMSGELRVRRETRRATDFAPARGRAFLNSTRTTLPALKALGAALVDVNAQHAATALGAAEAQLALLDRAAGTAAAAAGAAAALLRLRAAQRDYGALLELADPAERAARQALVDEVAAARVQPGEEGLLRHRLRALEARRASAERCALVAAALGGAGAGGALGDADLQLRSLLREEERLEAGAGAEGEDGYGPDDGEFGGPGEAAATLRRAAAALAEARAALGEAAGQVERYGRQARFSQRECDEAEERRQALRRLAARHAAAAEAAAPWAAAGRVDELAAAAAAAAEQLEAYAEAEGRREAIAAEAAEAAADLRGRALALAAARRAAAARMADAVHAGLADLAMGSARFEARLSWSPPRLGVPDLELTAAEAAAGSGGAYGAGVYDLSRGALDAAEFRFAAGPAEPLRPLGAVASGGEAARVMLAVKAAGPAAAAGWPEGEGADPRDGPPPTPGILVLDEVDSGVGARLGAAVGGVLRRIAGADAAAAGRPRAGVAVAPQVLCVSHLPQVAAAAEHHLVVRKALGADGRPVTLFAALESRAERAGEVAAMLGLGVAAAEALLAAGGGSATGSSRGAN